MKKHYVSKEDISVPMFENDRLNSLTRVHPVTPFLIFVPLNGFLVYTSLHRGTELLRGGLYFLLGFLIWTLAEYFLHRFVFHLRGQRPWQKKIYFMIHGVHHDYPNDSMRLVMPPAASIPLAVPFYFLFLFLFGPQVNGVALAGFFSGYLLYDSTHYAIHHFKMAGPISSVLKKHHLRHHYLDSDANYGVTSPFWDVVFGTYRSMPQRA